MSAKIDGQAIKTHRSLGRQPYSAGDELVFKIPQDIVAKEFIIVVNGYIACTFAGTKPTVGQLGILNGLLEEVRVTRKGTDRIKAFKGVRHLRATLERRFGQIDSDLYSVNATDLSGTVVQGLPVWGTTGQNVAVRASTTVMMENKVSGVWYPTVFNTKGLQTATVVVKCGDLSKVQDPEDANAGTYAGSLQIEVFASCADYQIDQPDGNMGLDFQQAPEELEFSGAQSANRHYINPKGRLQGMLITGLHSGSKPFNFKNMGQTRLEIKYQGTLLAEGSLADFLEIDMNKTMLTSRLKGSAYVSFLNNQDINSGVNIAEGKQLELIVTTDSTLSYPGVKLVFEYDSIEPKPQ